MARIYEIYKKPGFGRRLRRIAQNDVNLRSLHKIGPGLYTSLTELGFVQQKPSPIALPTLSQPVQVGVVVTATPGQWHPGAVPDSVTGQWQIAADALSPGVPIAGASGLTYTPVAGDSGKTLIYHETATNSAGSTSQDAKATVAAAAAPSPAPPPGP